MLFRSQGVLGEGTLVSWFEVLVVMVTRMDVLMCFRADILLEIPRRFRIDTEVRCMGAHPSFWPFEPARVKPN